MAIPPTYAPAGAKFTGRTAPGPATGEVSVAAGGRHRSLPAGAAAAPAPANNPNAALLRAGYTPNQISQAHALANAQTAGPLAALATQTAQNDAQNRGAINTVGGYFGQLGDLAKQGVTDQGQTGTALTSQLAQIAQDEQSALTGIGQNAVSSAAQYSPQASANSTNPGLAGLATEMARQQGLAAQQQGAFKAFGANQNANFGNLAASNLGTTALRGQEDLTNGIANAGTGSRIEPLMAQAAALRMRRTGVDFTTALGKLRQQDVANKIAEDAITGRTTIAANAQAGETVAAAGRAGRRDPLARRSRRQAQRTRGTLPERTIRLASGRRHGRAA